MVEQLTLFGERDPLQMICELFRKRYAGNYRRVLDWFSAYQGGTAPAELEPWSFYSCSPKGMELVKWEGDQKRVLVPKAKILRELGITDDKKDALKGEDK